MAQARPTVRLPGPPVAVSVSFENSRARHAHDSRRFHDRGEAAAVVDDRMCKENDLEETTKGQDAAYKVKVSKRLDMTLLL